MTETSKDNLSSALTALFIGFPVATVVGSLMTRQVWIWYAVPLGAPVLSLSQVIGLLALKTMVFPVSQSKSVSAERKAWGWIWLSFSVDVIGYLIAAGAHAVA